MSSKTNLQALAMDSFNLCFANSIVLEVQWIPRLLNERPHLLSRFFDKDDRSINSLVFRVIDTEWGPHSIDRFALQYNALVSRFNSKFASPRWGSVDDLDQDWWDRNNWVCPPVSDIEPSDRALSTCSGYGTLIIPQWPLAYFWPLLHDSSPHFKSFVKGVFELPCIHPFIKWWYHFKYSIYDVIHRRCGSTNMADAEPAVCSCKEVILDLVLHKICGFNLFLLHASFTQALLSV